MSIVLPHEHANVCRPRIFPPHKPVPPQGMPPALPAHPCPPPLPHRHAPPIRRPVPPACPPPPLNPPPAAPCAVASLADLPTLCELLTCASKPAARPPPLPPPDPLPPPQPARRTHPTADRTGTTSFQQPPAAGNRPAPAAGGRRVENLTAPPAKPSQSRTPLPCAEGSAATVLKRSRLGQLEGPEAATAPASGAARSMGYTASGDGAAPSKLQRRSDNAHSSKASEGDTPKPLGKPQAKPPGLAAPCKNAPKVCYNAPATDLGRRADPAAAQLPRTAHCSPAAAPVRAGAGPASVHGRAGIGSDSSKRPRSEAGSARDDRDAKGPRRQGGQSDRLRQHERDGGRREGGMRAEWGGRGSDLRSARAPRQPLQHMKREVLSHMPCARGASGASLPTDGDLFGC